MSKQQFNLTITEAENGADLQLDMEASENFVATNLAKTMDQHPEVFKLFLKAVSMATVMKKCKTCPARERCSQLDSEASEVAANMKQIIENGNHS